MVCQLQEGFGVLMYAKEPFQDGGTPVYQQEDLSPSLVFNRAAPEIKLEVTAPTLALATVPGTAEGQLVTSGSDSTTATNKTNRTVPWLVQILLPASSSLGAKDP